MRAPTLVLSEPSRDLRRDLGAPAWTAFEELVLSAVWRGDGWVAVGGVRSLAEQMGIAKNTAARIVASLVKAGLVTRERLEDPEPARRSGYRVHPPAGVRLCSIDEDNERCTKTGDTGCCTKGCDTNERRVDSRRGTAQEAGRSLERTKALSGAVKRGDRQRFARVQRPRSRAQDEAQGRLFDLGVTAEVQDQP
ncbi:MAG TPA: hypothetical protein DCQ30_16090 [Acidimicrobiaceae bacterium]|nr:hypothetical protein [Acidimicrobiaceae bacterium]